MKARATVFPIIAALSLSAALSSGYQGSLGSSRQRAVQAPNAPVTRREAATTVARMEQIIKKVVFKMPSRGTSKIPLDNKPVQRIEILREFNRLFELCRPKFKFTPDMTAYDAKDFTIGNDATAKSVAGKLVNWGAIGKVAPLVSSSKATVTVSEFGDAVGFFLARMSELTHSPSINFSPPMMDGG